MTVAAATTETITVTSISYTYLNPMVISSLSVYFTTPRALLDNEEIYINLGTDIEDLNSNMDRLYITLSSVVGLIVTALPMGITIELG